MKRVSMIFHHPWRVLCLGIALGICNPSLEAADGNPLLIIDSQDPSDDIRDFEYDAESNQFISVGSDKALRFWDMETGILRRTWRYHIGPEYEGFNYTLAIPDHREWMALGGFYGSKGVSEQSSLVIGEIRIISPRTGEIHAMLRGHQTSVGNIEVSADGKWLCSADGNGILRLWDLREFSIAEDQDSIPRIRDSLEIGSLNEQLQFFKLAPDSLSCVALTLSGRIVVWRRENEDSPFSKAYEIIDEVNEIESADFSSDGRWIVTGHLRDEASIWDADSGKIHKKLRDSTADRVNLVSFSPDSNIVFVSVYRDGGAGAPEHLFFSVATGKQIAKVPKKNGGIRTCKWIKEENRLIVFDWILEEMGVWKYSGNPDDGSWKIEEQYLISSNRRPLRSAGFSENSKVSAAFGHEKAKSADEWEPFNHVFDFAKLELRDFSPEADSSSFRRNVSSAGNSEISYEGSEIRVTGWNTESVQGSVNNDLNAATLTDKGDKLIVGYTFDLKEFTQREGETVFSRAFRAHTSPVLALSPSPDGRYFTSASSDGTLRLWDLGPLKTQKYLAVGVGIVDPEGVITVSSVGSDSPAEEAGILAEDIVISVDGIQFETSQELIDYTRSKSEGDKIKYLIERDGEQLDFSLTIRSLELTNYTPGPLASLFVSADNEWVCWLPSGHYHASPGGEKYIGWQINKGRDKLSDYYPSYVFRDQFHDPELVKRTILLGDFEKAKAELQPAPVTITSILPPKVEWKAPTDLAIETKSDTFEISASIESPDAELEELKLLVNGKAVKTEYQASGNSINYEATVYLLPGENHLSLFVKNAHSGQLSDSRTITRIVDTPNQPSDPDPTGLDEVLKPNLYVLSVGVSKYEDENIPSLRYCDDDATAIAEFFQTQSGGIFGKTEVQLLVNEEASEDGIQDALDWLEDSTTQKDFVVLFLAAHGLNDEKGNFYLLPSDANPERLRSSGVAWDDFGDILGNLPSRVLMFIDTCHSGQLGANLFTLANVDGLKSRSAGGLRSVFDPSEAIRELTSDENGVVIMAASTGDEESVESETWGHGAFTKGLLEGLSGGADVNKDKVVHLRELDFYVSDRVKELTKGLQHPTTVKPSTISRLPVAGIR